MSDLGAGRGTGLTHLDADRLRELGVAATFTPRDFGLNDIMVQVVDVIREARGLTPRLE